MSEQPFRVSEPEERNLAALLDELIPARADGRVPGAGALGLAPEVAAALVFPESQAQLRAALAWLADAAVKEGADDFAGLSREARLRVLAKAIAADPAFLQPLLHPSYVAYYQHERVARALGLEAWPPHPQGFSLETGDLSLLDPVRERGRLFREV